MTNTQIYRAVLISDFNLEALARFLSREPGLPHIEAACAPFGQVTATLLDRGLACWSPLPDVVVLWTQPQEAAPSFRRRLEGEAVPTEQILEEVDGFARTLLHAADAARMWLLPAWVMPHPFRASGLRQWMPSGPQRLLHDMQQRLWAQLDGHPGIFPVDTQSWLDIAGQDALDARQFYWTKSPFGAEAYRAASRAIQGALRSFVGQARKLVVTDLDDTLWGGTVGEVGWEGLSLGGHDARGEAFLDVQRVLRAWARQGVLLAIASKNDETVALEALEKHPEMLLRQPDFAAWRIDWNDKAANIAALAAELNLGLDSVVFLDNSAVERARVREALPEVLVPELPELPEQIPGALQRLDCFDTPHTSEEDRARGALYAQESARKTSQDMHVSLEAWLESLELCVTMQTLTSSTLPRAAQLLNKTNQMNLSTRRMSETELMAWAREDGHEFWTARVTDRFGDAGMVGLLGLDCSGAEAQMLDFVLSCRVLGRHVEETLLAAAATRALARGKAVLRAEYRPTPRNHPCLELLERSPMRRVPETGLFQARAELLHAPPRCVRLEWDDA